MGPSAGAAYQISRAEVSRKHWQRTSGIYSSPDLTLREDNAKLTSDQCFRATPTYILSNTS
uniref:Uncharacterized protein n=1 Tax=Anguilla anguilla TaxID=7936 RepID=A0A0E9ST49_ANGAN